MALVTSQLTRQECINDFFNVLLEQPLETLPIFNDYLRAHNTFLHYMLAYDHHPCPYREMTVVQLGTNKAGSKWDLLLERDEDKVDKPTSLELTSATCINVH